MKASEAKFAHIEYVSTGIESLDSLLGGGVALGCISEVFGSKSIGKSTLALQIIALAQKEKIPCLFADTEFNFTPQFASSLGVDCDKLELTQFRLGEETFDAIEEWVTKHKRGCAILDSMGGVLPREESEKDSSGRSIGLQSRLMASFCRRIIGLLAENQCALIIVNHEVTNISTGAIGSSGGSKLSHHKKYSIRLTPMFGKPPRRATDGSIRSKFIQVELKKEKGMDTHEGRKVELVYEKGRGFVNEVTEVKKGRPKQFPVV